MKEGLSMPESRKNLDNNLDVAKSESTIEVEITDPNKETEIDEHEIRRLEQSIGIVKIAANQVREKLGIPPSNEDFPSVSEANKRIAGLREFSKKYHNPDYRKEVATNIKDARKTGGGESTRQIFYEKTANEKETFESQEKERDVANLMRQKDLLIIHGMPILSEKTMAGMNQSVNSRELSFEDRFKIIQDVQPTISTSIPSHDRYNNGLAYKTGVILGGGKVLSAKPADGNSTAYGLYKRIPKTTSDYFYATESAGTQKSAIEPTINVDRIIPRFSGGGSGYNEVTVESPEIAGLYYDVTSGEISEEDIRLIAKHARNLKIPLYAILNSDNKIQTYRIDYNNDFSSFDEISVTPKEIVSSKPTVDNDEKVEVLKSLISKGVFSGTTSENDARRKLQQLISKQNSSNN